MAYREIEMWEVLEVLRRIHRGEKQRPMARVTGIARTTIRRYEQVARELGWVPELFEPDEALALAVTRQLRPGAKEPKRGAAEELPALRKQVKTLEVEREILKKATASFCAPNAKNQRPGPHVPQRSKKPTRIHLAIKWLSVFLGPTAFFLLGGTPTSIPRASHQGSWT